MKQWGKSPEQLDLSVSSRIPVVVGRDPRYFTDKYQGIPISGYARLIENMLDSPNIKLLINTDALAVVSPSSCENFKRVLCTGPIDEFFGYKYGKLEYRTVRFEDEILDIEDYQGNAVINYTEYEIPYTRIIEHKHFEFTKCPKTVISREYPTEWTEGKEAYYPINDERNGEIYALYEKKSKEEKNVIFGGRLGEYKYYDMDKVIARALEAAEKELK